MVNYRFLAECLLVRLWGGSVSASRISALAAALQAENVTVREPYPEGTIEVVVYVAVSKYKSGSLCVSCAAVDGNGDDSAAASLAFNADDTHRVRAIVPVFPWKVPTVRVEGEQMKGGA